MTTVAYLLRALKEERELWQVAANKEGRTLVSWIKSQLNKAAAKDRLHGSFEIISRSKIKTEEGKNDKNN